MTRSSVVLTDSDHGRRVEVATGQKVVVRLAENPTTGYRWAVEHLTGPLTLSHEDFESADRKRLGARGARVLTFTVEGSGSAEVSLTLRRSGGKSAAAKFEFAVEVADK